MEPVDVIIPTFRRLERLKAAVASVIEQTYPHWQLWVIDDSGLDKVSSWAHKELSTLLKSKKIQVSQTPSLGVSGARNHGVRLGNSPWIAFLDDDDIWLPHKLEHQIKWAQENPQFSIIHCQEKWIRNGIPVHQPFKYKKKQGDLFAQSVHLCAIGPSTVLLKRSLFERHKGFREDFPVCEDQELWLRICQQELVGLVDLELIIKNGGHSCQLSKRPALDYWRVKALMPFLEDSNLPEDLRKLIRSTIFKKCKILLRGYEKHNNTHQVAQVKEWQNHPLVLNNTNAIK